MMKKIFYSMLLMVAFSCNDAVEDKKADMVEGADTSFTEVPKYIEPGVSPIGGRPVIEDDETMARRAIIYMSIDSTYYAINAIEAIKKELSGTSSIHLSLPERNLKSKAISKMNFIQNSLARRVDSALLVNLKMQTKELANINNSISADIDHLKNLSRQLDKVSAIMSRVTDVLTVCISKGLIKPPTPIAATPEVVKESVK